jgi:hypothetical protein
MVLKALSVADQLVETREFLRFSKNRNVWRLVTLRRNVNFGFWILDFGFGKHFRQEDRICRMGGEEKAETGDWRPERKGRATGEGRADFGWWMVDF